MKAALRVQLSVMMFLEFFIWGSWYTSIGVYMSNHNMANLTHWPYTVNPIAAIIAPFFDTGHQQIFTQYFQQTLAWFA